MDPSSARGATVRGVVAGAQEFCWFVHTIPSMKSFARGPANITTRIASIPGLPIKICSSRRPGVRSSDPVYPALE